MNDMSNKKLLQAAMLPGNFGQKVVSAFEALRDDVEAAGVPGLISLLGAAIEKQSLDRKRLLAYCRQLCPPSHFAILRELLDHFEGADPKRHNWTIKGDGTYELIA